MKPDFDKIVMERGKRGHNASIYAAKKDIYKDLPFEEQPALESITKKYGWERKQSAWRSQPIKRWLDKQVGRIWDDVYSEFCAVFKPTQTLRTSIRKWAVRDVEEDIIEEAGKIFQVRWWWSELRDGDIYVDPSSRILKRYKKSTRLKAPEPVTFIELTNSVVRPKDAPVVSAYGAITSYYSAHQEIEGIWYLVQGYKTVGYYRSSKPDLHSYFKRQLSSKELKKHNLKNNQYVHAQSLSDKRFGRNKKSLLSSALYGAAIRPL